MMPRAIAAGTEEQVRAGIFPRDASFPSLAAHDRHSRRIAVGQNLPVPAPPIKKITIVNNSAGKIYPVLSIGIKLGNPDLWMQAQFVSDFPNKNPYPPFPTTLVYRAYINEKNGIPPKHSVQITVPFFTQLKQVTASNIGVNSDQFIDWWNAARVYLFDGATALNAAKITDGQALR
jgi:hypothetical protein